MRFDTILSYCCRIRTDGLDAQPMRSNPCASEGKAHSRLRGAQTCETHARATSGNFYLFRDGVRFFFNNTSGFRSGGCVVWSRRRERGYRSMKVGRHVAYPTNRAAGRRRGASAGADRAMSRHSSVTARDVRHGGFRCRVKSARTSPWSG
ncbi:hypothetical protein X947_4877 [Burkholderia pseudomallei MSHR7334]|nr:hypothetical protein X947_4877 [Burkholderia pseudomallei MSHR7334]